MEDTKAFAPVYGPSAGATAGSCLASTSVTANNSTATASTQFSGNIDKNAFQQIRIANKSTSWAHVNFGKFGAITAATVASSFCVAPGAVEVFTASGEVSGCSVILDAASTGSSVVVFTRGAGI
jgi:hypothetical protein